MSDPRTVSRRTLAAGAAWSLPVIAAAAAAPAYAASPSCDPVSADWNVSASGQISASATNGVTATTRANGSTYLRTSTNLSTATITNGVKNGTYLLLDQAKNNSSGQTVTLTFPQPVYCVTFYVNDIDTEYRSNASKYQDVVSVPGFTPSTLPESSANLTITGSTVTSTRTATSSNMTTWEYPNTTSAAGLVKYTASGPLSSFSLTFSNSIAGTGTGVGDNQQQVYISGMTYKLGANCTCP